MIDTNQPDLRGMPRFESGRRYEVTARSLLLFMLRPKEGAKAGGLADQSFEHVMSVLQSIEEAPLV